MLEFAQAKDRIDKPVLESAARIAEVELKVSEDAECFAPTGPTSAEGVQPVAVRWTKMILMRMDPPENCLHFVAIVLVVEVTARPEGPLLELDS